MRPALPHFTLMPGVVCLHVWQRKAGAMEFQHLRRLAVFDVQPGAIWRGFATFVTSLSREYACEAIYDHSSSLQAKEQPGLDHRSSSLLSRLSSRDPFAFPASGELTLVIIVPEHKPTLPSVTHTSSSSLSQASHSK